MIKLEIWKSTLNQEERHYFRVNKGKGYQGHQYVFGYNPEVVKPKLAKKILEMIKKSM